MTRPTCSVDDCSEPTIGRGWCRKHYYRVYRYGTLETWRGNEEKSFWRHVEKTDTCWLWTGTVAGGGYGRFDFRRQRWMAHRWSYERLVGPIPEGLQIDHLCRVRNCVNPEHLEAVTGRVNTLRGNTIQAANAAKTHCKHGHEFTVENTYIMKGGWRSCRTCSRLNSARYKAERAQAAR